MSCSDKLSLPASSTEFIRASIVEWGGMTSDPTAFPVQFAFTKSAATSPTTWITGEWEIFGPKTYARILIGPGSTAVLARGTYVVWIKLSTPAESPVRDIGVLQIS